MIFCYELFQVSRSSCNMNHGLLLSISVFTSNCDVCVLTKKYIKKIFSCVLHTANTLTCFERFFIQKILEV